MNYRKTCISIQRYVVGCEREKRPLYLQQTMFLGLGGFEGGSGSIHKIQKGEEKRSYFYLRELHK